MMKYEQVNNNCNGAKCKQYYAVTVRQCACGIF